MKTLAAMEVRKHFGAVIDEVRMKSETIILERAGKPVAMIEPYRTDDLSEQKRGTVRQKRLDALTHLCGLGSGLPRSNDLDGWLLNERSGWNDRS
jgi:antitoxin (DNA-binding transcriptional repressor) of toxin-antitoxin stability system